MAKLIRFKAFEQIVIGLNCAWMLGFVLPMQQQDPKIKTSAWMRSSVQAQQYVIVYTWAYLAVEFTWYLLYNFVGRLTSYGMGMALAWLGKFGRNGPHQEGFLFFPADVSKGPGKTRRKFPETLPPHPSFFPFHLSVANQEGETPGRFENI